MAKATQATKSTKGIHNSATKDGLTAKDKWWQPYYDPTNIYFQERVLFGS